MNRKKYKYFDKLYIQETKLVESKGYYYEWYGFDYEDYEAFWDYERYLVSKSWDWYGDWLDDPSRIRDSKIDEILSEGINIGNLGMRMPKSLFK
jgi:hypothetical protein